MLSQGSSHRTTSDQELIAWGEPLARLDATVSSGDASRWSCSRRLVAGILARRPQAGEGQRCPAPDVGPQQRAPRRRVRARGHAARGRITIAASRLARHPRGAARRAGRGVDGHLRPRADPAQQPAAPHPRGGREPGRAALLGRRPGRGRGPHPAMARRDPGRPGRPARRRARRDRAGRGAADHAQRVQRCHRRRASRRRTPSDAAWPRPPTRRSGTAPRSWVPIATTWRSISTAGSCRGSRRAASSGPRSWPTSSPSWTC